MAANVGQAPTLEELAEAKFGTLTQAEAALVQLAPAGRAAVCNVSPNPTDRTDPANDPARAASWDAWRTIRPALIRWMCIDSQARAHIAPNGVRVWSAVIREKLDLSFVSVEFPLEFVMCGFLDGVDVSGANLRALILSRSWTRAVRAHNVAVRTDVALDGVCAAGPVELLGAKIDGSLSCSGGRFLNDARDARVSGRTGVAGTGHPNTGDVLVVDRPVLGGSGGVSPRDALVADRAVIGGSVFLNDGFRAEGAVRLPAAEIGGQFVCRGGQFRNRDGTALYADGVIVKGSVDLDERFRARGGVRLHGAEIAGQLNCGGGRFLNRHADALNVESAVIKGSVSLGCGFIAHGAVRLVGAHTGQLNCSGGRFRNPRNNALAADGVVVSGDVVLSESFRAFGTVRLPGAQIAGQLNCGGGRFLNRDGVALDADGAVVRGDVLLNAAFCAAGTVQLNNADIGGQLSLQKADLTQVALNAEMTHIAGALVLRRASTGPRTEIDLAAASAGVLTDSLSSWPLAGRLELDGFTYGGIVGGFTNAAERCRWLRLALRAQAAEKRFRPQPYRQLAKVLGESGHEAEARDVLIAMEDDRRKYAALPGYAVLWAWVLRITIGYGYRPLRALAWIAGFFLIGFMVFGMGYRAGLIVPSDATAFSRFAQTGRVPVNYPPFCAAVYSFNAFVPIIDLGQSGRWTPAPAARRPLDYSNAWARLVCGAVVADALPLRATPSYPFLVFYAWTHTLFGWFFTTMFFAGVTGLVRH